MLRIDQLTPCRHFVAVFFLAFISSALWADNEDEDEFVTKKWREFEAVLPAPPAKESLKSFFVSSVSDNQFFVDLSTISVGSDGVVRYVLVVLTPEGARNVTFEGMRCESRERRIYASGRRDGAWSKSRSSDWVKIQDAYANRVHAALFLDFFCPGGVIVRDADEARDALKQGLHRDNKLW